MTAKTFFGLEGVCADELKELGASQIRISRRAVYFRGNKELMYRANLHLATSLRVLMPIRRFKAQNEMMLYEGARQLAWDQYITPDNTLAVDAVVSSDYFNHSHFCALKLKDAIVDQLREKYQSRPSVDTESPDVRIHLHIVRDECTISLDSSGESLNRRGYRTGKSPAPMNECLAAGLIRLSGWDGQSPLLDPMTGSGTLAIEAALYAYRMPPGILREKHGFMSWKDFDAQLWREVKEKAKANIREEGPEIRAADSLFPAIRSARENIKNARLGSKIDLDKCAFENQKATTGQGTIIMNPPYGHRMDRENITEFYRKIGDQLKQEFTGWTAWIISSNQDALKNIGLRTSRRIEVMNGKIESRFVCYELFKGSGRKDQRSEQFKKK